jgi:Bacterial type II and III secretion system protein
MRKIALTCCLLFLMPVFGVRAFGQDTANALETAKAPEAVIHYYHLVLVVQEMGADSKPVNSRSYSTAVSTNAHNAASIRTGSRVPIATGYVSNGESKALVNTQFQYVDVGVNFDVRDVHEVGRQLTFDLSSEVSSVADSSNPNLRQPVIRENKWHSMVFIPIGKPTVVFTSDSVDSKGSMQVVVTATPLE